jgi:hypothetical protein
MPNFWSMTKRKYTHLIELKIIATKNIRTMAAFLDSEDIINKIMPLIKTIVNDDKPYIRGRST